MFVSPKILKEEHEQIERELLELETIMKTSIINFPNLIHVLKKLKRIWDEHEEKEEPFFRHLLNKGFTIPMEKITFEHSKLKKEFEIIMNSIKTLSEDKIHDALEKNGKNLINKLRQHMSEEDWILYALPKKAHG